MNYFLIFREVINSMKKAFSSNFKLWLLIGQLSHSIILARQRELNHQNVPVRQLYVLRVIQELGPKATLSQISLEVQRKIHVISRQTIRMERDGLIKRTKSNSKSNLLTLKLTKKGLDIINVSKKSKSIDVAFSSLSLEEYKQLELILNKLMINAENEDVPVVRTTKG